MTETETTQSMQIMHDGRPLHAWWSEIQILRKQKFQAELQQKQAQFIMKVCGIAEIEWEENIFTKNWYIEVKMTDMVKNGDFRWDKLEYSKIIRNDVKTSDDQLSLFDIENK